MQDILPQSGVVVVEKTSSKKRLLREIADAGQRIYNIKSDLLFDSLMEREELGPTAVGGGVAIPHARVDDIDEVCGVFVRLSEPVEFDSDDHKPVDLAFALFAPSDAGASHLKALARVSRVLRDNAIRKSLRSAENSEAIYSILINSVDSVAA